MVGVQRAILGTPTLRTAHTPFLWQKSLRKPCVLPRPVAFRKEAVFLLVPATIHIFLAVQSLGRPCVPSQMKHQCQEPKERLGEVFCTTNHMAVGQNPLPPVNIPSPTKIGSKMGGARTPKWDPIGFDQTALSMGASFCMGTQMVGFARGVPLKPQKTTTYPQEKHARHARTAHSVWGKYLRTSA